jgi:hypothetical protein
MTSQTLSARKSGFLLPSGPVHTSSKGIFPGWANSIKIIDSAYTSDALLYLASGFQSSGAIQSGVPEGRSRG